jgi:hypothetical protein
MLWVSWWGWPAAGALLLGSVPALWLQVWVAPGWRRWALLGGLPALMLVTAGVSAVGPWGWMGLALILMVLYPLQAWRDAPVFPTPRRALQDLAAHVPLAQDASILDAGSGLGHGLQALCRAYGSARIQGVESSLLLVLLSRWRLRHAGADGRGSSGLACQVVHGDMWSVAWSGFDLVYVFQRPESMQRAWDKACREMPEGSWLVSLEFEVPGLAPAVQLTCPDGRFVWIYRICENRNSVGVPIGR